MARRGESGCRQRTCRLTTMNTALGRRGFAALFRHLVQAEAFGGEPRFRRHARLSVSEPAWLLANAELGICAEPLGRLHLPVARVQQQRRGPQRVRDGLHGGCGFEPTPEDCGSREDDALRGILFADAPVVPLRRRDREPGGRKLHGRARRSEGAKPDRRTIRVHGPLGRGASGDRGDKEAGEYRAGDDVAAAVPPGGAHRPSAVVKPEGPPRATSRPCPPPAVPAGATPPRYSTVVVALTRVRDSDGRSGGRCGP